MTSARKSKPTAVPKLTFEVLPHVHPEKFKRLFSVAAAKWPGISLGYAGTDAQGNHYMQQRGNPKPFVVSGEEADDTVHN